MAEYTLVEPFDIDDGSLNSLSKQECFVLGVEWASIRARLLAGERFVDLCHESNAQRIEKMAERHGRYVEHHPCGDGWSRIFVGTKRS